ncbi:His-Xaa-Ser system protein HxsD [Candidatus Gracilibacteria bacterium]|nr:His-Xaa-Ser system protein HxsD [Candidatus Gracilibacteria bacterium]
MIAFLSQNTENNRLELSVDRTIFSDITILKSAYTFLDRAYFFFQKKDDAMIVQIQPKDSEGWSTEKFALEYSDELLATFLRFQIEKENKEVRETIVRRALGSYADLPNFTSIQTTPSNQIDFDKDIDEILREIENDPELKIDEEEINRILAEIEAETALMNKPKTPTIDPNKLKDVKKNFQRK